MTASRSSNPLRGMIHLRRPPAPRLQAGELTRSNRGALLPVVLPDLAVQGGWTTGTAEHSMAPYQPALALMFAVESAFAR